MSISPKIKIMIMHDCISVYWQIWVMIQGLILNLGLKTMWLMASWLNKRWSHWVKRVRKRRTNTTCSHLFVESKTRLKWAYLWTDSVTNRADRWLPQERVLVRHGLEAGVSRWKRLQTEQKNNWVLLRSPGNCIPHPVINHNARACEEERPGTHNRITVLCSGN